LAPRLRWPLLLAGPLLCAVGCAQVGPPPGGPEDREAPRVEETIPPADAAAVAPDSAITIVFSEKMDHRSVMRALVILPPVDLRKPLWEEGRLRLQPETGWAEERNTILWLGATAKDRRGNVLTEPFTTRFSTRAHFDSARVGGVVWAGKELDRRGRLFVGAYSVAAGETVDPQAEAPVALKETSSGKPYRLSGLDPAATYGILGWIDRDGDLLPGGAREPWAEAPARITFAPEAGDSATALDFLVGTIDSTGSIPGEVSADSGAVVVIFAVNDSTGFADTTSVAGSGPFTLSVPTGFVYRVGAFLDADGDSAHSEEEPLVLLPEPVSLRFVSQAGSARFDLQGLGPAPAEPVAEPPPVPPEETNAERGEGGGS
jgi:hypothetical protein